MFRFVNAGSASVSITSRGSVALGFAFKLTLASLLFATCAGALDRTATGEPNDRNLAIGMKNPAAVYCQDLGYAYELDQTTGDNGICTFPDGSSCDEWSFLSGLCGVPYNACSRAGFLTRMARDGQDPFLQDYAVCFDAHGDVSSVANLVALGSKAEVGRYELGPVSYQDLSAIRNSEILSNLGINLDSLQDDQLRAAAVDWRNYDGRNYLTPIRNQGGCGSCTAFSTLAALENTFTVGRRIQDPTLNLSEQTLVALGHSLPPLYRGVTCCGGYNSRNLFNLMVTGGVPDEKCLPYLDGRACSCGPSCGSYCRFRSGPFCSSVHPSMSCSNAQERLFKLRAFEELPDFFPDAKRLVMKDLLMHGAILPARMGVGTSAQGYYDSNGVYRCHWDSAINHAVTLVGFNSSGWIVRNSWGSAWGDHGYFTVGYGECGIESDIFVIDVAQQPSIPACGTTITSSTTLIDDLRNCSSGIHIAGSGITLDCQGHAITGLGTGSGISVSQLASAVTIKNCRVSGFYNGIYVPAGPGHNLFHNYVERNHRGIFRGNTIASLVIDNQSYNNQTDGFEIVKGYPSIFDSNRGCGSATDLRCGDGTHNTFFGLNWFGKTSGCPVGSSRRIPCEEAPIRGNSWSMVGNDPDHYEMTAAEFLPAINSMLQSAPGIYEVKYSTRQPSQALDKRGHSWWDTARKLKLPLRPRALSALQRRLTRSKVKTYFIALRAHPAATTTTFKLTRSRTE